MDDLITQEEAAKLLSVKPSTLEAWRHHGRHAHTLPFVKLGRMVRYCRPDVEKFIAGKKTGVKR